MENKRRSWVAVLLSLLVPGLGQVYNGQVKKGIFLYLSILTFLFVSTFLGLVSTFCGNIIFIVISLSMYVIIIFDACNQALPSAKAEPKPSYHWCFYVFMVLLSLIFCVPSIEKKINPFFFYEPYIIGSDSMSPTLNKGERIITKKYTEGEVPARGDIIIFSLLSDSSKEFLKRVVGVPGDRIDVRGEAILINKRIFHNKDNRNLDNLSSNPAHKWKTTVLPAGCYYVVGDDLEESFDSRSFGCIDISAIKSKAQYIYWSQDTGRIGSRIRE